MDFNSYRMSEFDPPPSGLMGLSTALLAIKCSLADRSTGLTQPQHTAGTAARLQTYNPEHRTLLLQCQAVTRPSPAGSRAWVHSVLGGLLGCGGLARWGRVPAGAQRGRGWRRRGERPLRQWASSAAAAATSPGSGTAALFSAAFEQSPRLRRRSAHKPRHACRQRLRSPSPGRGGRRSRAPASSQAPPPGTRPQSRVLPHPKRSTR
jgi:hypothetical protein